VKEDEMDREDNTDGDRGIHIYGFNAKEGRKGQSEDLDIGGG
jgi:hypothetical protein